MINTAISNSDRGIFYKSMENLRTSSLQSGVDIQLIALTNAVNKNYSSMISYPRYWHGYLLILKPLLIIFDYKQIRYINMILLLFAFILTSINIYNNINTVAGLSFISSMLLTNIFIIPMSLQFSSVYYIMFITLNILISFSEINNRNHIIYLYFITGCLTSFFDLLTAPLLTLGFLLSIGIIKKVDNNSIKYIIKNSLLWGIGYTATWISKVIIATIIIKENIIMNAFKTGLYRIGMESQNNFSLWHSIIKNFKLLNISIFTNPTNSFPKFFVLITTLIFIFTILIIYFRKRISCNFKHIIPLLIISTSPYIWYIIMSNHSTIHYWMTYRSQSISIFCILYILLSFIDLKKTNLVE